MQQIFKGGDDTSSELKKYYEENGKKVYYYLLTICGDPDVAEELTQETFYQALRSIGSYRGDSSVFTWLCGIAKNLWLSEQRRRRSHPQAELDPAAADLSPPPDEAFAGKDQAMYVLRQIHALPEQEKELILLRASAGLSFREIGEIFGRSENWARVSYYRAKQKLKRE